MNRQHREYNKGTEYRKDKNRGKKEKIHIKKMMEINDQNMIWCNWDMKRNPEDRME